MTPAFVDSFEVFASSFVMDGSWERSEILSSAFE